MSDKTVEMSDNIIYCIVYFAVYFDSKFGSFISLFYFIILFHYFISLFYFIILFHYKKANKLTNAIIRTSNPDTPY
jgi:hypothetical protein